MSPRAQLVDPVIVLHIISFQIKSNHLLNSGSHEAGLEHVSYPMSITLRQGSNVCEHISCATRRKRSQDFSFGV